MVHELIGIGHLLLSVITWIILIQVILSWLFAFNIINTSSQGVRTFAVAIDRITAPVYRPVRRILPDFGGIDFSPLIVIILIAIAHRLLTGAETSLITGTV